MAVQSGTNQPVNRIDTDYRAEVIAAILLEEANRPLDHLLLNRTPSIARPHTKDIASIRQEPGYDGIKKWILESHREGLYEMLPEHLFHEPTLGSLQSAEEEILIRIRKQRTEEAKARTFFSPFEQEITYLNILMYVQELRICKTESDDLIHIFEAAWPFLRTIEPSAARMFIHILPFLHQVKGNFHWAEHYISLFASVPVTIRECAGMLPPLADDSAYTLGNQALGDTMLLYGPASTGELDLEICIGPVPAAQIERYLPGAPFNAVLEALYRHLIPFHKAYTQKIIPETTAQTFVLNDTSLNVVGYTAYL